MSTKRLEEKLKRIECHKNRGKQQRYKIVSTICNLDLFQAEVNKELSKNAVLVGGPFFTSNNTVINQAVLVHHDEKDDEKINI